MSDREVRSDAVLKRLPEQALEDLWRMRNPEEGGEPMTLEAICVEIPRLYNVSCSMGALSNFFKWLRLKRLMESGRRITDQVMEEMRKDPTVTVERMNAAARYVFTHATLDKHDPKTYIALIKLQIEEERLKNDSRRIKLLEDNAANAKAKLENLVTDNKGGLTAETLKIIEEAAGLL